MKNILITGIPRSGTSLFSSLVAENQRSVVFSEPSWLGKIRETSRNGNEFTKHLIAYISQLRNDIIEKKPLKLKINKENKKPPTNYYIRDNKGKITSHKNEMEVIFEKKYSNYPFYIKSNAQFTSCLSELIKSKEFKIYCVIRNPVSCIMSWRSLQIPVSHGNMKIAEKYSKSYRMSVLSEKKLILKQIKIIEWFYETYYKNSKDIEIIFYEDLISNTKKTLEKAIGSIPLNIPKLESKNKSSDYNLEERSYILEHLKASGRFYKLFYPELNN